MSVPPDLSPAPLDEVVGVRGAPTPDEIAALLAALTRHPPTVDDPYERWRRQRIAALRSR